MGNYVSLPILPVFNAAMTPEENHNRLVNSLSTTLTTYGFRLNQMWPKDGSEPMRYTPVGSAAMTLPTGDVQMEDRSLNLTLNATFGGGTWKSHDTSRPSWQLRFDMSLNRGDVRRAMFSAGSLSWVGVFRWPTPAASMRLAAGTSIASGGYIKIPLDTPVYAAGGMTVDTVNNRLVVGLAGRYSVTGQLVWLASATGANRAARIYKNGLATTSPRIFDDQPSAPVGMVNQVNRLSADLSLAVNDYLELYGYQDSGAGLNAVGDHCYLQAHFIGAGT